MKLSTVLTLTVCLTVVLSFTSCASEPAGPSSPLKITKVNPYHNKPGQRIDTTDPMIAFEQRHVLHGAVHDYEFKNRFGHYFSVFWESKDRAAPIRVRLEYTQAQNGAKVEWKEVLVTNVKRNNTTKIVIAGPEYLEVGQITSWRVLLISGETVLAENKSFLWK